LAQGLIGEFDQEMGEERDRLRVEAVETLSPDEQQTLAAKEEQVEDLEYRALLGDSVDAAVITKLKGEVASLRVQAEASLDDNKRARLRDLESEEKRLDQLTPE
jgi:hypothetical protein